MCEKVLHCTCEELSLMDLRRLIAEYDDLTWTERSMASDIRTLESLAVRYGLRAFKRLPAANPEASLEFTRHVMWEIKHYREQLAFRSWLQRELEGERPNE